MNKIREAKEKLIAQFKKIQEKGENVEYADLVALEKIISKDETEPMFIISYLKLLEKFEKDKYDEKIEKYLFFLSSEDIKKHFPSNYNKKINSSSLFHFLFQKIESFDEDWFLMLKIQFYNELLKIQNTDIIKGVSDYTSNKELFIYNLYRRIINGIIKHINNFTNFKPMGKEFIIEALEKKINDAKNYLSVEKLKLENSNSEGKIIKEENDMYKIPINQKNYDPNKIIEESGKQIDLIKKIASDSFKLYFSNFRRFLKRIKKNYYLRFKNIENLENKDINLFMEFCFFLESHNFERDSIKFYIYKWNDTFYQTDEYIEIRMNENSKDKMREYKYINKDMVITNYIHEMQKKKIKIIKNIDKYSINCVINYFNQQFDIIEENTTQIDTNKYTESKEIYNDYYLEKFLKFDSNEYLYINKIWKFYEDYLVQIFTSKTIKTAVEQMFSHLKVKDCYDLLNEDDIKAIFRRSKFYGFESNIFGLTEPLLLIDFVYYKGMIESYGEEISKLFNLCLYQIIQEHEILGHIEIRIQDYILEQEVKSPKMDYVDKSNTNKIVKEYESGEYIEKLLYGQCINQLSYNKILFLLDVENYKVNYSEFKENFKNCDNGNYEMSESLKQFLKKIKIELSPKFCGFEPIMINRGLVEKVMNNNNLYLYQRRHTHLHPSKDDNNLNIILKNIIDEFEKYKKLNN